MLFPTVQHVDETWSKIAKATVANELGMSAKVATNQGQREGQGRLICVYTKDYGDVEDVERVLKGLVRLGVVPRGKGIYYKAGKSAHK